jgi:serine/threonine protein kinase
LGCEQEDWFADLDWETIVQNTIVFIVLAFGVYMAWRLIRHSQANTPQARAKNLEQQGDFQHAAKEYQEAGDLEQALSLLKQNQQWGKAAAVADKLGKTDEAANLYRQANDMRSVVRVYRRAGMLVQAAEVLWQEGQIDEAVRLFETADEEIRAATLLLAARDFARAARLFHSKGERLKAAECMLDLIREPSNKLQEGDLEQLLEAAAEMKKHERLADAASLLQAANRQAEAAEMFVEAQQPKQAAISYEKTGQLKEAADLYRQIGDQEKWLELTKRRHARGDKIEKKEWADALAASGDRLAAGLALFELGDVRQAITALQKLPPDHVDYRKIASLLGRCFSELGDFEMAMRMHRRATEWLRTDEQSLELFYAMARTLEGSSTKQHQEEAKNLYADILEVNYSFLDVQARHAQIGTSLEDERVFGKYLLLSHLGRGGMAEVFRAKKHGAAGFEKMIAIKRVLPHVAEDETFVEQFIDEAKIAGQLSHANIAQVFDFGRIEGVYFIALEYVHGRNLRAFWKRMKKLGRPFPVQAAAYIVSQVCAGLDYAHRKKDMQARPLEIVHRDVSPQNILVSYEGEIKVIDFGIAKAASASQHTKTGMLKGKFAYMSPEQVRGLPLDRRSDIFSAGIVLWELLCGRSLFKGESEVETLEKVRNAVIPAIRSVQPSVPVLLERITGKALAAEPSERFATARDFQQELERFLSGSRYAYSQREMSILMQESFAEEIERIPDLKPKTMQTSQEETQETEVSEETDQK